MTIRDVSVHDREQFNSVVTHPLQSFEWGEFREKEGVKVLRRGVADVDGTLIEAYQLTIHKIPRTPYTIGYLPKGNMPNQDIINDLKLIGKQHHCLFIQLEPNIMAEIGNGKSVMGKLGLRPAAHPLFTKHTFVIDLTKSDEELLAAMHSKARYNIKVAKKHGVSVTENNSDEAFKRYWELTEETTKRQQFYAHTKHYHELQWQVLKTENGKWKMENQYNHLTSHLLTASYQGKILTTWIVFVFHDTLYYPYGASSNEHRETMHSTLMMWEAMQFGKKLGLKKFDLWGAAAPGTPASDPWFGFTNFKERFGPKRVEFIGSFDLVLNPFLYQGFRAADKIRWLLLRLKK